MIQSVEQPAIVENSDLTLEEIQALMPKLYGKPFLTLNRDDEGRPALIFEDRFFRCDQMYETTPLSLSVSDRLREFGACLLVAADSLLEADGYDTEHRITAMKSDTIHVDIGGVEGVELRVAEAKSDEHAIQQAREALTIWTHGKATKPVPKRPAGKIELVHYEHYELGLPDGNPFGDDVTIMVYNQRSQEAAKSTAEEFLEYMLELTAFNADSEEPLNSLPENHVVLTKPCPIILQPESADPNGESWGEVSLSNSAGDELPGVMIRVQNPNDGLLNTEQVVAGCNRLFDFIVEAAGIPFNQCDDTCGRVRGVIPQAASDDAE